MLYATFKTQGVTGIGADGQQTLIMENGLFAEAFDFRR